MHNLGYRNANVDFYETLSVAGDIINVLLVLSKG
jgi:hypothetical protein